MHEYCVKLLNATATVEKNRKLFNCFYLFILFFVHVVVVCFTSMYMAYIYNGATNWQLYLSWL